MTPSNAPTAPTIGTATAGNGEATVSWTAPTGGSGTIVRYYVSYYVNGSFQDFQPFDSTATTQTVTGLTNGVTYSFTVIAGYSNNTNSPESAQSTSSRPPGDLRRRRRERRSG